MHMHLVDLLMRYKHLASLTYPCCNGIKKKKKKLEIFYTFISTQKMHTFMVHVFMFMCIYIVFCIFQTIKQLQKHIFISKRVVEYRQRIICAGDRC